MGADEGAVVSVRLVALCLEDRDPAVRGAAARALIALKHCSPAVLTLAAALTHTQLRVRRHAAQALGKMGAAAVGAAAQLGNALSDSSADVRRNAALALNSFSEGNQQHATKLVVALRDASHKVRRNAAQALGRIPSAAADSTLTEALSDVLSSDVNNDVRKRAADALGLLGPSISAEAIRCLGAVLVRDSHPDVRRLCAVALSKMGLASRAALGSLNESMQQELVPQIRGLVNSIVTKLTNQSLKRAQHQQPTCHSWPIN